MRTIGLVLSGLVLIGAARADDAPDEAKQTERLKKVLDEWEKASKSVRELHYRFTQTEEDRNFHQKTVRTGQVCIKMLDLIRIDLTEPDGQTEYFLYEQRRVHHFIPKEKTEAIFALPKEFGFPEHPKKYPRKEGFLQLMGGKILEGISFMFIQPPLREMQVDGGLRLTKEDENWICLELQPHTNRYKCDFKRCEVVLDARTYQVRRLWFQQPNDRTIRVDIEKRDTNPKPAITAESIRKGLPQDWKQETPFEPKHESP